ncbi:glycoside hydrolase domain-containing protein [Acidisphaera sp. S103]|uniref:glycoside hydrolase domain-containing protein n=1 Tax=Acidisphaera sp. S103 TaxID=1747223 RepID=UPI00131B7B6E|nr:glycoside hydrolase domain-containing protein [Acidisphaera sp. S103]
MAFGIDTFQTRLDLLLIHPAQPPPIDYLGYFKQWNGGTLTNGVVSGGDPAFAGRNFLGGDFIWGHAEHTNASQAPNFQAITDPAFIAYYNPLVTTALSPNQPENLQLTVNLIAPIQAPQHAGQQQTGQRGFLFGRIDAQAICNRILACINSGELSFPFPPSPTKIWLAVDPDPSVNFTPDYWAGWSNFVNTQTFSLISSSAIPGIPNLGQQFQACILCSYTAGAKGLLQPDTRVTAALNDTSRLGLNKTCHAFWADTSVGAAGAVAPNPVLNWNSFDQPTMPMLWRLNNGIRLATDTAQPPSFPMFVDAINPDPQKDPTKSMLTANKWQPNVASIVNLGFSHEDPVISKITCLQTTKMPSMGDNGYGYGNKSDIGVIKGHFFVPGSLVKVIGRYLRSAGTSKKSPTLSEVLTYSQKNFSVFTVWESTRLNTPSQIYPSNQTIDYYDPQLDTGTLDGKEAFTYCGNILTQPPQTPVYFALDNFDPTAVHPDWILTYFEKIKAARDDYANQTGFYYLIGVYSNGGIMEQLYSQGIVSHFWQPVSAQATGSLPPRWPWYHVNRWQYTNEQGLFEGGGNVCSIVTKNPDPKIAGQFLYAGPDPDADWGDGGTWNLTDPVASDLRYYDQQQINAIHDELQKHWNGLMEPAPLPAVTSP